MGAAAVEPVPRAVAEGFFQAVANRDFAALSGYLADDVTRTVNATAACIERVGKDAVLMLLQRIAPSFVDGRRFVMNAILVDGDRAAMLARFAATKRVGGRALSFRTSHFVRFCGGKAVEYSSIIDRFDAVEQVLGHALGLKEGRPGDGELVAI
jgi:ketosteroid isomerase-like protein